MSNFNFPFTGQKFYTIFIKKTSVFIIVSVSIFFLNEFVPSPKGNHLALIFIHTIL